MYRLSDEINQPSVHLNSQMFSNPSVRPFNFLRDGNLTQHVKRLFGLRIFELKLCWKYCRRSDFIHRYNANNVFCSLSLCNVDTVKKTYKHNSEKTFSKISSIIRIKWHKTLYFSFLRKTNN